MVVKVGMFTMNNLMTVKVLFFATIKDRIKNSVLSMNLEKGTTVMEFKKSLVERFPILEPLAHNILISINQEFGYDNDVIPDQAEVGVFPAVSGGSEYATIIEITSEEIDTDKILKSLTTLDTGAICSFWGVIRGVTKRDNPHETVFLEYESYVPMAEKKMEQIAEEIREKWPEILGVALIQRIGKLSPLTPTVFISCSASHRDTGVFEAARYGIDRLKQIVPIWKKEVGPKGEEWVEGDYHPNRGD